MKISKFFSTIKTLNHPNTTCGIGNSKALCVSDLSSYKKFPEITDVNPDYRFYLGFDLPVLNNEEAFAPNTYTQFMRKNKNRSY